MKGTRRKPRARYSRAGDVTLTVPYHAVLVARLKRDIPSHARAYDPAHRTWTIDVAYAAVAIATLLALFPDAVIEQPGRRPEPQPIRGSDQAFAILHLMPSAPDALVEVVYRFLARRHHPDIVGGTGERMRELNDAYAELKEKAKVFA